MARFPRAVGFLNSWIIAVSVLATACFRLVVQIPMVASRWSQMDFSQWYVSGYAVRYGIDPYTTNLQPIASGLHLRVAQYTLANYPPTFILLFEPLTRLSAPTAYALWASANFLCFFIDCFLLFKVLGIASGPAQLILAALALGSFPMVAHLRFAQVQFFILLLLLLCLWFMLKDRPFLSATALAIASLLKVYPSVMIGFLLARRQGKIALLTMAEVVAGVVLTSCRLGPYIVFEYGDRLRFLHQVVGPLSLSGIIKTIGEIVSLAGFTIPDWVGTTLIACGYVVVLWLTMHITVAAPSDARRDITGFALWLIVMVLFTPTAWIHYAALFLPFYYLLAARINEGTATALSVWLGAGSFAWAETIGILVILSYTFPSYFSENVSRLVYDFFFNTSVLVFTTGCVLATANGFDDAVSHAEFRSATAGENLN